MIVKGISDLKKLKKIAEDLEHNGRYTAWEIMKASGDSSHFKGELLKNLCAEGVFVCHSAQYLFNRKRLYSLLESVELDGISVRVNIKAPLRW